MALALSLKSRLSLKRKGGVAASPPVNSVAPVISGTGTQGQTLTVTNSGTWSNSPTNYFRYWYWSADTNFLVEQTQLDPASSTTHILTATPVGRYVACLVVACNGDGCNMAWSNAIGPIGGAAVNQSAPVVSGTTAVGSTLTVTPGTYQAYPSPTLTYQWYRNDTNNTTTPTAISGATSTTYLQDTADAGQYVYCVETATNIHGATNTTSNIVGLVSGAGYYVTTPVLTLVDDDPLEWTIDTVDEDGAVAGDTLRMRYRLNGGSYSYVDEVLDDGELISGNDAFPDSDLAGVADGDLVELNVCVYRSGSQASEWSNELEWTYVDDVVPETASSWATSTGTHKSQYVTVNGTGNLVATGQSGFNNAPISVRASQARTGKRYAEFTLSNATTSAKWVGVDDGTDNFNDTNWSRPGVTIDINSSAGSCNIFTNGMGSGNQTGLGSAVSHTNGDKYGIEFDTVAGTVSFFRKISGGSWVQIGATVTGISMTNWYVNIGFENSDTVTAKFDTGQDRTLTSGYVPYDN